jgi:hypothetical protein
VWWTHHYNGRRHPHHHLYTTPKTNYINAGNPDNEPAADFELPPVPS